MTDEVKVPEITRNLATVQRIVALDPIPNADKIEVATVLAWKVVVKKDEFKVGDLCVFFEIDSILPFAPWSEFLRDKNRPDRRIRLKTVRLRGQVSQGLAIPIAVVPWEGKRIDNGDNDLPVPFKEGDDVTEILGVKKWEPDIPAELAGQVRSNFPSWLIKTDTERCQSNPALFDEFKGLKVYITGKVDGTSFTCYDHVTAAREAEGDFFGVCSRNLDLKESDTNTYWRMAREYGLRNALKGRELAIQAEVFGPGIQKNKLGVEKVQIGVFDVFHVQSHRYFDYVMQVKFCEEHGLPRVKDIFVGIFPWASIEEMMVDADKLNYDNGTPAEGFVIRPVVEQASMALKGARLAMKAISRRFLLTYGE